MERLWFRLVSELCFDSDRNIFVNSYEVLMNQWSALAESYPGWTLKEVQKMSPRERLNWLEIARERGKVKKS